MIRNLPLREGVLFALLILAYLLPVWSNVYFLTVDGPSHLYNAKVLTEMLRGEHASFFQQFYVLNDSVNPNWSGHLFLALLMLVLPPILAEKLLITAYLLLFLFAFRGLLRSSKLYGPLLLLAAVFSYSSALQSGFWNFVLSTALYFFMLWRLQKQTNLLHGRSIALFSILYLLIWVSHPIGWAFAVFSSVVWILFRWLSGQENYAIQRLLKQVAGFSIAVLPTALLTFFYLLHLPDSHMIEKIPLRELLENLVGLKSLAVLKHDEGMLTTGLAAWIGFLVLWGLLKKSQWHRIHKRDVFLVLSFFSLLLYIFIPDRIARGGYISMRLEPMPYLFALLWLWQFSIQSVRIKNVVLAICLLITGSLMLLRFPLYHQQDVAMRDYASAFEAIPDHSVVLPLNFSRAGLNNTQEGIHNRWTFVHAGDYLGAAKPVILLGNYEATNDHFPLKWQDGKDPFVLLPRSGDLESLQPDLDLQGFTDQTGTAIEYVLLWGFTDKQKQYENCMALEEQLHDAYDLIYTSPQKWTLVYQRKSLVRSPSTPIFSNVSTNSTACKGRK